jgi:hypothetical protein
MGRQLEAEEFLRDVAAHSMAVLLDTGMYRHLRFQQPRNSNMWFDLVTWPGVLTIHGDMGTWTFSRVQDMFTFFRDAKLRINKDYWAEKLQHGTHGGRDGAKVWDEDLFKEQLLAQLENHDMQPEDRECVVQALRDEVLSRDGKYDLVLAARDFSCRIPSRESERHGQFTFDSCELPDGKEYAYHFVWCLYAIVWGIQQYDAALIPQTNTARPTQATPEATAGRNESDGERKEGL